MPRPRGIVCNLCNQEIFKHSWKVHRKKCEEKFAMVNTMCEYCGHPIPKSEIGGHIAQCRKRHNGKKKKAKVVLSQLCKQQKVKLDGDVGEGESDGRQGKSVKANMADSEDAYLSLYGDLYSQSKNEILVSAEEDDDGREPCGVCGRKFSKMRIVLHEAICAKANAKKKRLKIKTGSELRTKGTDFAAYNGKNAHKRATTPEHTTTKNTVWRKKHDDLMQVVAAGRQEKLAKKLGIALRDMPAPDTKTMGIHEDGDQTLLPNHMQKAKLWSKVQLDDGRKGIVKFVGRVPELEAQGNWIGIALTEKKGQHDGAFICDVFEKAPLGMKVTKKINGQRGRMVEREIRYFRCKPGHGIFVRHNKIVKVWERKEKSKEALLKKATEDREKRKKEKRSGASRQRTQSKPSNTSAAAKTKLATTRNAKKQPTTTTKTPPSKKNDDGYVDRLRQEVASAPSDSDRLKEKHAKLVRETSRSSVSSINENASDAASNASSSPLDTRPTSRERRTNRTTTRSRPSSREENNRNRSNYGKLPQRSVKKATTGTKRQTTTSINRLGSSAKRTGSSRSSRTNSSSGGPSVQGQRKPVQKGKQVGLGNKPLQPMRSNKSRTSDLDRASMQYKAKKRAAEAQKKLRAEKRERERKAMSTKSLAARNKTKGPGFGSGGKTVADELNSLVFGKEKAAEIMQKAGTSRFFNSKRDPINKMNKGAQAEEKYRRQDLKNSSRTLRQINGPGNIADRKAAAQAFRKAGGAGKRLGGKGRATSTTVDPRAAFLARLEARNQ